MTRQERLYLHALQDIRGTIEDPEIETAGARLVAIALIIGSIRIPRDDPPTD